MYDAFAIVEGKTGENPVEAFQAALENIMPVLEVKARRVGGSTYQVPMEVRAERRQTLGLRWIVTYSRTRGEKTMAEKLANEILDAINAVGGSEHFHLAHVFATCALRSNRDFYLVPRYNVIINHGRGIIAGVNPVQRILHHALAKIPVTITLPDTLMDRVC